MKIFVVGGTGFIGSHLIPDLLRQNHEISVLVRPGYRKKVPFPEKVRQVKGDALHSGPWQRDMAEAEAVINLAGNAITPPWTTRKKNEIRRSRIETTRRVASALSPSQLLFNASAIGYYGFSGDEKLTEEAPPGDDFLASLCRQWESEANSAPRGTRVIVGRFGVVLGYGGVIQDLAKMLRRFLGGRFGSGKQWFSWVHIDDLIRAIEFCLQREVPAGTYNICSPCPVQNETLMKTLAQVLDISTSLPIPASVLRILLGEFANMVLKGQRVYPDKLLKAGFEFDYPQLRDALEHLLRQLLDEPSRRFW